MRIHIIGVATTFMSGLALLARQEGHEVTASDSCIFPKMRKQLESAGVQLKDGFSVENLAYKPDLVIIGNELFPDNEELLEARKRSMPYISGVLWLEEYVLYDKWKISAPSHYVKAMPSGSFDSKEETPADKPAVKKHAPKPQPEPGKLKQRIVR